MIILDQHESFMRVGQCQIDLHVFLPILDTQPYVNVTVICHKEELLSKVVFSQLNQAAA